MLVKYIIENNGATIDKCGKIITLKSGYQVSKKDLGRVFVSELTEQMINDIITHGLKRGEYAGFWIEDGYLYVDISVRISTKKQALNIGRELKQIAIWDWVHGKSVLCAE